jgi:hypothetical protein
VLSKSALERIIASILGVWKGGFKDEYSTKSVESAHGQLSDACSMSAFGETVVILKRTNSSAGPYHGALCCDGARMLQPGKWIRYS